METAEWRPQEAATGEYFYDSTIAATYKNFIESLCVQPEGFNPGAPLKLIEWQVEFLDKFYATLRWSEEFECYVRQHNEAFIGIAKKNGKTGYLAALAIAQCAIESVKERQDILIVAADKDQSKIMFKACQNMIEMNPRLGKAFKVLPGFLEIRHRKSGGTIRVKAPDDKALYGQKPTMVIIDELVAQKSDEVYKTLKSAGVAKREFILISITTAGYINKSQFCYDMWLDSRRVQTDPLVNPRKFVWIRETALDVDPSDRKAWAHANPGFGVTKSRGYMEDLYTEALTKPSQMAEFKAMQLNQWVDGSDAWIERHIWDNSGGTVPVFDPSLLDGRTCYVGMDLSKGVDFSSVAYVFPGSPQDKDADAYTVLVRHWISEDGVKSRKTYFQTQCKQWADDEWLTIIPGNEIKRQRDILPVLKKDFKRFNVLNIGADPYLANDFGETLENELDMEPIAVGQTYTNLSEPTKTLEHYIVTQKFWHNLNPVLGWQMGNVVLDRGTQGDIKINKKNSSGDKNKAGRIDGIAAIINGLHVAEVKEETVYSGFIPMGRR